MSLWQHQKDGIDLMTREPSAMLAFDMGTGKTRTVIEFMHREQPRRTLIVAPKSVVPVWPREFEKVSSPFDVREFSKGGTAVKAKEIRKALESQNGKPLAVVINYDSVWRDRLKDLLRYTEWDLIVADESHKIKAHNSRCSRFMGLFANQHNARRVCLTGTPMPHSPLDVFGQYRFLRPDIYGTNYTWFKNRYCQTVTIDLPTGGRFEKIIGWVNQEELHDKFYSIAMRVNKRYVLDLPPTMHTTVPVRLSDKAWKTYKEIENGFISYLESGDAVTASNVLAKMVRMQQIASGFVVTESGGVADVDGSKADALADLVEGIDRPIAVFCKYHHTLDAIKEVAKKLKRPCRELSGRINEIGGYWDAAENEVAAIQIQAGGVGIDLTACADVVYYDQTWSLGEYDQSLARVDRPGQKSPVTYYHLLATGTIDEGIKRALEQRVDLITSILERRKLSGCVD